MREAVARLPFRAVNRRGAPGYDPGLQRHHIIPRQALRSAGLAKLFATLGCRRIGFDDFRRNGMLLPAREDAVRRLGLPLHRGPHRAYNEMVIERLGEIETWWERQCRLERSEVHGAALQRIGELQRSLMVQLLSETDPVRLNRRDPRHGKPDFTILDAMADQLWEGTAH